MNNLQLKEINELQIGLKDFKVKPIALMDSTLMLLHRKYPKQSKVNQQSAEQVKELLNQEQNLIEKQFTDTKQEIYQILQQNIQRNNTQTVTTSLPGASASTGTDPATTEDNKLPYFVARNELTKKCETLKYSFTPKQIENFFSDHLIATSAQYPRDWQSQLVKELRNKFDSDWKDLSVSWNWQELTWEQLKIKITSDLKLGFPPLTQRDHWFNLNKQSNETIPQYIRKVHSNMSTSYLNQGLTKN